MIDVTIQLPAVITECDEYATLTAPLESSDRWIGELGDGLVAATNAIADATDYGSAMAHQIALDILLGKVLSVCYKLRLNGLVPR